MNPAGFFPFSNSLNPMNAGLGFQSVINSFAANFGNQCLITVKRCLVIIKNHKTPAFIKAKFLISPAQIGGKNRRFFATRSGSYFQDYFVHILALYTLSEN